jgi:hypothetical protein
MALRYTGRLRHKPLYNGIAPLPVRLSASGSWPVGTVPNEVRLKLPQDQKGKGRCKPPVQYRLLMMMTRSASH